MHSSLFDYRLGCLCIHKGGLNYDVHHRFSRICLYLELWGSRFDRLAGLNRYDYIHLLSIKVGGNNVKPNRAMGFNILRDYTDRLFFIFSFTGLY